MYKILVIDDNHSFIDSFKVMLKDYPLQIESTYKFHNAREMLSRSGNYKNTDELNAILQYNGQLESRKKEIEAMQKGKAPEDAQSLSAPDKPVIHEPPFNHDGYLFIITEYDTESGTKANQFIQEIVRSNQGWQYEDFIMLTTKIAAVESIVKSMGIPVFEKPIKQSNFKSIVTEKLQAMQNLEKNIVSIMNNAGIKVTEKVRSSKNKGKTSPAGIDESADSDDGVANESITAETTNPPVKSIEKKQKADKSPAKAAEKDKPKKTAGPKAVKKAPQAKPKTTPKTPAKKTKPSAKK